MPKRLNAMLATLLLATAAACDSDNTTGGSSLNSDASAATEQQMTAFCDAQCSHDEACPDPAITKPSDYDCRSICRNKIGSNLVLRAASVDAMIACYQSLACGQSDDQCSAAGMLVVTNDPENFQGVQSCLKRHQACESNAAGGFSDDLCFDRILLIPTAANTLDNCIAQACDTVHDCFDVIIGQQP